MTEVIGKPFEDREDYWAGRHMEVERTIRNMIELECIGQDWMKLFKDDSTLIDDYVNAVTHKILIHEWEAHQK